MQDWLSMLCVMAPACPPGVFGSQRAGVKVAQGRCTALPSGGGVWKEGALGASFFLCLWESLGGDPSSLPCLGKGKRKHHLVLVSSHR